MSTMVCKQTWSFKELFCLFYHFPTYAGHWRNIFQFTQARIRSYWSVASFKKKSETKAIGRFYFQVRDIWSNVLCALWIILCWRAYFPCIKVETAYLSGEESLCLKYKWVSKLTSKECFLVLVVKLSSWRNTVIYSKLVKGGALKPFFSPFIYSADGANI